jgi:hypothetical protein
MKSHNGDNDADNFTAYPGKNSIELPHTPLLSFPDCHIPLSGGKAVLKQ